MLSSVLLVCADRERRAADDRRRGSYHRIGARYHVDENADISSIRRSVTASTTRAQRHRRRWALPPAPQRCQGNSAGNRRGQCGASQGGTGYDSTKRR